MAERKHRHIMEIACSLLLSAGVPNTFCGGPILTDVYLTNIILYVITSSISPFERLFGKLLDYFSSRVFGCTCFVLPPSCFSHQTYSTFSYAIFLGYGEGQKGY